MSFNRRKYYTLAAKASKQVGTHPGLLYLQEITGHSSSVLDVGCGEGTRLSTLLPAGQFGWGVDIDSYAINLAQKQYPRCHFRVYSGKRLPYKSDIFDLVYSAFVLEHTRNPGNFLNEMIRVCQPGGHIVILCPNFGSPNRRSPNSVKNPLLKLISGLINDFFPNPYLKLEKVNPRPSYDQIDADTTLEPYLLSLLWFFNDKKVLIESASSLWELEASSLNPRKLLTKILGQMKVYPFKYWGPQIFISVTKPISD